MLCKDCKHIKTKRVGMCSYRSYCNASQGSALKGTKLGVEPSSKKEHPKCPMKGRI